MKYKAIIFDLDGLMVDTERMCYELWKEMGKTIGVDVPIEFYRQIIGTDARSSKVIFDEHPFALEVANLTRPKRDGYIFEFFPNPGDANKPGLEQLVNYLRENDYKIAIASSSRREYVDGVLGHLGFDFQADVVVTGSDVSKAKPDPEIFTLTTKLLGLKPNECLVLEDSKNGIIAAAEANLPVIFIEDLVPADDVIIDRYLAKLDSLFEVITFLDKS